MSKPRDSQYSEAKRRKILKEAAKLFLEKGYAAASIGELLRRVGGSKTTIYSHFGDKAALFAATLDDMLQDVLVPDEMANASSKSLRDALIEIAMEHLQVASSERYIRFIRIVAAEVERFPELGQAFYTHGPGRSYRNFTIFLEERQATGQLSLCDPELATDMFLGTLLHRRVLERTYGVTKRPK